MLTLDLRDRHVPIAYDKSGNFGDELSPVVVQRVTGMRTKPTPYDRSETKLVAIGSVMHRTNQRCIVWGAGAMRPDMLPASRPTLRAVRGPLTRKALVKAGHRCPEVFGDPASLLPWLHAPDFVPRSYPVGVFPHYVDKDNLWLYEAEKQGAFVIEAKPHRPGGEFPLSLVAVMLSCETIVTSSLHGLIVADAYGIPCVWADFGGPIGGGTFKFDDYLAGVDYFREKVDVRFGKPLAEIVKHAERGDLSRFHPQTLIDAFPGPTLPRLLSRKPLRVA